MPATITTHRGVNIIYSAGYYYPECNTNIECLTMQEVIAWLDEAWFFVDDLLKMSRVSIGISQVLMKRLMFSYN